MRERQHSQEGGQVYSKDEARCSGVPPAGKVRPERMPHPIIDQQEEGERKDDRGKGQVLVAQSVHHIEIGGIGEPESRVPHCPAGHRPLY